MPPRSTFSYEKKKPFKKQSGNFLKLRCPFLMKMKLYTNLLLLLLLCLAKNTEIVTLFMSKI